MAPGLEATSARGQCRSKVRAAGGGRRLLGGGDAETRLGADIGRAAAGRAVLHDRPVGKVVWATEGENQTQGAGKTTLLSVLGGRPQLGVDGYWRGEVRLNGVAVARRRRWRRELAYVLQKDIFFESLTVRQELEFTARLRGAEEGAAADVARRMGLEGVLDQKIGSNVERGLSGGESKRLNIAAELVASPRVALLDEPLTGLDSFRAHSILVSLRALAESGTGVLLSVHTPTSKLWALFDRLLLLAPGGRVVYDGKAVDTADYFASFDLAVPPAWNPPDYFVEVVSDEALLARLEPLRATARSARDPLEDETPRLADFSVQVSALTRRGFLNAKGTILKPLDWVLVLSLALVWGLLWYGVARDETSRGKHADDIVSICFFFVAQWSWGPAFQHLGAFPAERDVLAKELASEAYSIEAFFVSKQLAEIPISALLPAAFYAVAWPLVGLPPGALPAVYLATLLETWVAASLTQALSALVFDSDQTTTVLIIIQVFQMCCGGYFIDMAEQPAAIAWLRFSSYWYYCSGLFLKLAALPYDTRDRDIHRRVRSYSFSKLPMVVDVALLVAFGCLFRAAAYVALKTSRKIRFT